MSLYPYTLEYLFVYSVKRKNFRLLFSLITVLERKEEKRGEEKRKEEEKEKRREEKKREGKRREGKRREGARRVE